MSTINDTDFFVVNRGDTDYKISTNELDLYLNPVPTFVTAAVGQEQSNWSPYVTLRNYNTKAEYDPSQVWYFEGNQEPDRIFDGNSDNIFQWASYEHCELEFKPPGGIQVYNTFSILAGFAEYARVGVVTINGEDIKRHEAWDRNPEYFEVEFSGTLDSFSIRQELPVQENGNDSWSGGISEIVLDGKQLLNQTATTLTFKSKEFFDQLKVGTKLQQVSPEVTGVVSKIYPDEKRVVLDDVYPLFETDSTIIIVGADPIGSTSTRGVPVDNDYLLVNRGDTDYKITTKDLKDYIYPKMPWDDHVANGGVVLHIKDATGTVNIYPHAGDCHAYEIDGTYRGEIDTFDPGEELVVLYDQDGLQGVFNNNSSNWNFGELTDVSNALDLSTMFDECSSFNGTGMSDWDVSKVKNMIRMFKGCSAFNQDLSKWCVSNVDENARFDQNAPKWQDDFKPVWGTCPDGSNP